jgi:uncharacterized RDD family membrane protein YckC
MNNTDTDTAELNFAEKNAALTRNVKYATFNMRMFAAILDAGLVLLIAFPLGSMLEDAIFSPVSLAGLSELRNPALTQDDKMHVILNVLSEQHMLARMAITNFLQLSLFALYIIPCWIRYSSTPGKMLAGIEIRDAVSFELMTRKQMIKRFLGYIASGIPLTLGFVWMIFNKKKQCWHDKIAGTIVVIKEKRPFKLRR